LTSEKTRKDKNVASIIISGEFDLPGGSGYADFIGYVDRASGKKNWHSDHDDPDLELTEKVHAALLGVEGWDFAESGAGDVGENKGYEYGTFLDYMDRKSATIGQEYKGNAIRLFTSESDRLSESEKEKLRAGFSAAEKKGSLLWKTVISFETSFLRDCGLYEDTTRDVDDRKLTEYGRAAIMQLLKSEKFETALWCGEIHKNKAHYHIHFAYVDPEPSWTADTGRCRVWEKNGSYKKAYRAKDKDGNEDFFYETVTYKAGEKYQRGTVKTSSYEAAKSAFVSLATGQSDINKRINDLMRNRLAGGFKNLGRKDISGSNFDTTFFDLLRILPDNMSLWKYNMNAMGPYRETIDRISDLYIEEYAKEDYAELLSLLDRRDKYYKTVYGKTEKSFKENHLKSLKERMGNSILKKAAECEKERRNRDNRETDPNPDFKKNVSATENNERPRIIPPAGASQRVHSGFGIRVSPASGAYTLYALKRLLRKDIQSAKNLAAYDRMRRQAEQEYE
jgi:hypothetical protein